MSRTAGLGVHGFSHEIHRINQLIELQLKNPEAPSFHESHKQSCYIYFGGLDRRLTEGDIIAIFSQWGEVVDVDLIRDRDSGESKGFGFLAYEDQRSTVLAVDNGNGMRVLGHLVKVDHASNYTTTEDRPLLSKLELKVEKKTNS